MSKRMPTGRRDRQITVRRRDVNAVDAEGTPDPRAVTSEAYQVFASRVDILPGPGFWELLRANQFTARGDVKWFLPFRDEWDPDRVDVPKEFVIEYGTRTYDITHAEVIGRKDQVALTTLAKMG
jgi:hypothetical protein